MNRFRTLTFVAAVTLVLSVSASGCAKKKVTPPAPQPAPPPVVQQAPPPAPQPAPPPEPVPPAPPRIPTEDEVFASKSLEDLNREQPLAHVSYDFDSYQLSETARAALDRNATWLRRYPSTKIAIEGHADSRGTNEYNLALGDRRAAAARDYLISLGIAADRMTAVSKGEEQPFCSEETESCWALNRRGYFVITAK